MSDGSESTDVLEQRVAELEATVRGLTEELVDATERVRELERKAGMHDSPSEKRARRERKQVAPEGENPAPETSDSPEDDTAKRPDDGDSTDSEESSSDDIIVA